MPDPKIHCLNVKEGDCFLIERPSGRVTMIDICCGNIEEKSALEELIKSIRMNQVSGDYGMRENPTNPITYLSSRGINEIWRFILTHPDMDHVDGLSRLFSMKTVYNIWDCGIRRDPPDFEKNTKYLESDWDFYMQIINNEYKGVRVVSPRAGHKYMYYGADDERGGGHGDYISIIAPNEELIASANEGGDINDASYVIVYRSSAGNIIFPGDSNDKTWQYILKEHRDLVENAAVLFAPHHGRKSGRDYSFLDVVNPRISFFGCAPSEELAYSAWQYRQLPYFTNNQCGNIHVYPIGKKINVFIENKGFAQKFTNGYTYQKDNYWYLCEA